MSVIGDFTVPAESFALDHALTTAPEMTVEADRLASHSTLEVLPFLWVSGGDFERFKRVLEDDPSVEQVTIAEETASEILYRFEWDDGFCDLINEIVDHHAAIMEAKAHAGRWRLKLRFSEESEVSLFQQHFQETDRTFTVNQLYHPTGPRQREFGLTAEQYETLVAAAREGYFGVPRSTSVEKLGDDLGVSANSVSQRLRRGTEALVQNTLTSADDSE